MDWASCEERLFWWSIVGMLWALLLLVTVTVGSTVYAHIAGCS